MRNLLIFFLALAMVSLPIGCSKDSTSPNHGNNISNQFGGFTASNEQPYFGDTALISSLSSDQVFEDSLPDSTEQDSLNHDTSAAIYSLRIVWGRLAYDSLVTTVTDWSGSLEITNGVEILRRTINFEPMQDYILHRTDPRKIEWVSKTTSYHDGILVDIYVNATEKINTAVTFSTAPFTISYYLQDLAGLDTTYYLSDSNAVSVRAVKNEHHGCLKGFLAGQWGTDDSGNGVFDGSWMTHNGIILGYIRGIWGIPDSSGNIDNAFYGKYIDVNGNFVAFLKGDFFPHPNMHANHMAMMRAGGWFEGNFYDAGGAIKGDIKGRYKSRPHNEGSGFFQGRWKTDCPSDDDDD